MTTLILGAGAMGSLFAAGLARAGLPIAIYDPDRSRIAAIRERGLLLTEGETELCFAVDAYHRLASIPRPERLLLLVKSHHTAQAAMDAEKRRFGRLPLLSLQNGIGHEQTLRRELPRSPLCLGVTYLGARLLAPGRVQAAGRGPTVIAPAYGAPQAAAEDWAALLAAAGFAARAAGTTELKALQWRKLAVNAVINPLTALFQIDNGSLLIWPDFPRLLRLLLAEIVEVARAEGVSLDADQLAEQVRQTCEATARNHSSMLSDMEQGKRTEIEAINGAICRLGAAHGLDTPENLRLYQSVRAREQA